MDSIDAEVLKFYQLKSKVTADDNYDMCDFEKCILQSELKHIIVISGL